MPRRGETGPAINGEKRWNLVGVRTGRISRYIWERRRICNLLCAVCVLFPSPMLMTKMAFRTGDGAGGSSGINRNR